MIGGDNLQEVPARHQREKSAPGCDAETANPTFDPGSRLGWTSSSLRGNPYLACSKFIANLRSASAPATPLGIRMIGVRGVARAQCSHRDHACSRRKTPCDNGGLAIASRCDTFSTLSDRQSVLLSRSEQGVKQPLTARTSGKREFITRRLRTKSRLSPSRVPPWAQDSICNNPCCTASMNVLTLASTQQPMGLSYSIART